MPSLIVRLALGIAIVFSASGVVAGDIPGSCLVTFNVKDKTFSSGITTMNCRVLEGRRIVLFNEINALPNSGSIDGTNIANRLDQLEKSLKDLESAGNWTGIATTVSGNFLATLGLSACLETAGAGCAVAVVGKLLSLVDIIDSAVSDAQKANETAKIRLEISTIRKKVATLNPSAGKTRDRLVAEFNGLCADVKKNCLGN